MYKNKDSFKSPLALIALDICKYDPSMASIKIEFLYKEKSDYLLFLDRQHKYNLEGLSINFHMSDTYSEPSRGGARYGQTFSIDIHTAKTMVKTLSRIETLEDRMSNYNDIIEYLTTIFKAFKVEGLLTSKKKIHPTTYREYTSFYEHELSELKDIISALVRQFKISLNP